MIFSIIVPIYNSERTLNQCVDSVLRQLFNDFELILVDDGSTDSSPQICDEYASKDGQIRVIHKENGGVSSARNAGIDVASGEWVCFIDSDDYIKENFLIDLTDYTEDFILTNALVENNGTFKNFATNTFDKISINDINELGEFLNRNIGIFRVPWGKLYRRDIIGDLRFNPNLKIGEDAEFVYNYLARCSSVATIPTSTYVLMDYDISVPKKYKMTTDYAINSLSLIFDAYEKIGHKFDLNHSTFIHMYFFFKRLSKPDWGRELSLWYGNCDVKRIYKYIYNSLSIRQKIVEGMLFCISK